MLQVAVPLAELPLLHGGSQPLISLLSLCGFAEVPALLRGEVKSSDKYWHMLVIIIIAVSQ